MKRLMITGLLVALGAAVGFAEEAATTSHGAVTVRDTALELRGNDNKVLQYDGNPYNAARPNVDASVGAQGAWGLADLELRDIGSTQENAKANVDYKDFRFAGEYDRLWHRFGYNRALGTIVNGQWQTLDVPTPKFNFFTNFNVPRSMEPKMSREVEDFTFAWISPENSARYISANYWSQLKKGQKYVWNPTTIVNLANINNKTEDLTLDIGAPIGDKGAVNVEASHREFVDNAALSSGTLSATNAVYSLPIWPNHDMNYGEVKVRYQATPKVAMTAAITGRTRENHINQYKTETGVAVFNVAYQATSKLNLLAKAYGRYFQVLENTNFIGFNSGGAAGQGDQLDKTTFRGDLKAAYQVCEAARVNAAYNVDYNHRRDAPTEEFTGVATYADGTIIPGGYHANVVQRDNVKHTGSLKVAVELPLGAELEGGVTHMQANRPAFIDLPSRSDNASGSLVVPLGSKVDWSLTGDYTQEKNDSSLSGYHMTRNFYATAVDLQATDKVSMGLDGSFENARYNQEGWFAGGDVPTAGAFITNLAHEPGWRNTQRNSTLGAHARVKLPKGFVVRGNGGYTWSVIHMPTYALGPVVLPFIAGATPANTTINDLGPSDVRIARGELAAEYTPPTYQNLTARVSYRIDDWVDKFDSAKSGRASLTSVSGSMKF